MKPELPAAILESVGYHKGFKAAKTHADILAECLRDMLTAAKGLDFACEAQVADALADYERSAQ